MACDGRVGVGSYTALVSWYEVRCVGGKVLCQGACGYLCVCNDFCEDVVVMLTIMTIEIMIME